MNNKKLRKVEARKNVNKFNTHFEFLVFFYKLIFSSFFLHFHNYFGSKCLQFFFEGLKIIDLEIQTELMK